MSNWLGNLRVMIKDEFFDFRVKNGVEKGPLKQNRRDSAIFWTCQKHTTVRLGGTGRVSVHVVPLNAFQKHTTVHFPQTLKNLIFLPPMSI